MLKDCFSTRDVLELTGVTARQLQWWDERQIVVPERKGRNRMYSAANLVDILVIEQLRQRSISLAQVRRVLRLLRTEIHLRLIDLVTGKREYHLLLAGKRIFLETDSKQVIELLRNTMQPMLLINLTDTLKPLRVELEDLFQRDVAKKPVEQSRRASKQRVTA
ncbi:MAG TPA: MerR family transcriptional regulator [Silvibacterium sp.]|jgi:DNA-binding transcriptional MerR regulator|nr:MerR family transcriptional regulator [Silvibacterium sp.]